MSADQRYLGFATAGNGGLPRIDGWLPNIESLTKAAASKAKRIEAA